MLIPRPLSLRSRHRWLLACASLMALGACSRTPVAGGSLPPLALDSVTPASGPEEGGTQVVLLGDGFDSSVRVWFGPNEASAVTLVNVGSVAAITPPGELGAVDVRVERAELETTRSSAFAYVAPPTPPIDASCVVTVTPPFGDDAVSVDAVPVVAFSIPQPLELVASAVSLTRLADDAPVPFTVEPINDYLFAVRPSAPFAYFDDVVLSVDYLPAADPGEFCASAYSVFSTYEPAPLPRPLRAAPANAVALVGDVALVASTLYRGLQVYDLGNPASPTLLGDVPMPEPPTSIAVSGDRAYVPSGSKGVVVFDVSNPTQPVRLGVAGTPGEAVEAVPFTHDGKELLAIADGPGGLRIVDVTNPLGPKDVAVVVPSGEPNTYVAGVSKFGSLLAVAQLGKGFALVDVSQPAAPSVLVSRPSQAVMETVSQSLAVNDVAIDGAMLYASIANWGVQAFDVSDPAVPLFLDHLVGPQGPCAFGCPDEVRNVIVHGGEPMAASAMTGGFRFGLSGGVLLTAATLDVPGRTYAIAADDARVVLGTERGLAVFARDFGDGDAGSYQEPAGWGTARGVAREGNALYVTSSSRGLETYDVSNPQDPVLVDLDPTPGVDRDSGLVSVALAGSRVVVADGRAGITVFDASTPLAPVPIADLVVPDQAGTALTAPGDEVVYVCVDNSGVAVVDVGRPTPILLGTVPFEAAVGSCVDLALVGSTLYAAGAKGLAILDVTNPASPLLAGSLVFPAEDRVSGIALLDDLTLLASTADPNFEAPGGVAQRLLVLDVSNPLVPLVVNETAAVPGSGAVRVVGHKALVPSAFQGLAVFDCADPLVPRFEGSVELPGFATSVAMGDGVWYVTQRAGGLAVIPTKP